MALGNRITLALQSSLMLVADLLAEHRADVYTAKIQQIHP